MPEQNQPINTLPIKTASGITATDYILGIGSAEEYQMLIQDLGDYIIQHATSSLAGQSQTLADVISGLDIKTTALYYMGAYNDANQVFVDSPVKSNCRFFLNTGGSNSPDSTTGWMIDQFKDLTTYGYQVARRTNDIKVYQRNMLNGTWSNWILQPTRTELEALNNKMKTISSGSLRDIKTSGIYYVTGGVTDKPVNNGGYYSASVYNNDLLVGTYVSTDNYVYAVKYIGGVWSYEQLASRAEVDVLSNKTNVTFTPTEGITVVENNLCTYGKLLTGNLWISVPENKVTERNILGTLSVTMYKTIRVNGFLPNHSAGTIGGSFKIDASSNELLVDNNYRLPQAGGYNLMFCAITN